MKFALKSGSRTGWIYYLLHLKREVLIPGLQYTCIQIYNIGRFFFYTVYGFENYFSFAKRIKCFFFFFLMVCTLLSHITVTAVNNRQGLLLYEYGRIRVFARDGVKKPPKIALSSYSTDTRGGGRLSNDLLLRTRGRLFWRWRSMKRV